VRSRVAPRCPKPSRWATRASTWGPGSSPRPSARRRRSTTGDRRRRAGCGRSTTFLRRRQAHTRLERPQLQPERRHRKSSPRWRAPSFALLQSAARHRWLRGLCRRARQGCPHGREALPAPHGCHLPGARARAAGWLSRGVPSRISVPDGSGARRSAAPDRASDRRTRDNRSRCRPWPNPRSEGRRGSGCQGAA